MKLFLRVSETVISNQEDGPDGLNEKKKLLDSVENYAKHICFTLEEQQEVYVGELKVKIKFHNECYFLFVGRYIWEYRTYLKYVTYSITVTGSLVGSFSVQQINGINSIESSIDVPNCNTNFHKKCIKQKSKVIFKILMRFCVLYC